MSVPTDRPSAPGDATASLRRRILFVICTTLVALVAAGIYLGVRSTSYKATANILVAPLATSDPGFQGVTLIRESSDGTRPVQTAVGLVNTPEAARMTASRLGMTQAKVENAVEVQPRGESNLVAVSAHSGSATEATGIANDFASSALRARRFVLVPALRQELRVLKGQAGRANQIARVRGALTFGDPTLSVSSRALPPTEASSPSSKLILLVALIVGLLVGVAGILLYGAVSSSPETAR
jgi:Capsular polysaccharide biosynthesis protein